MNNLSIGLSILCAALLVFLIQSIRVYDQSIAYAGTRLGVCGSAVDEANGVIAALNDEISSAKDLIDTGMEKSALSGLETEKTVTNPC